MNTLIRRTTWYGMEAWALENERLRLVVVPEMGAKMVSLAARPDGPEWLAGPGSRPFQKVPYGAAFEKQDMSGWDEMFPTITACEYPHPGDWFGRPLPDHGEVWALPWTVDQAAEGRLSMHVEGVALPYRLHRHAYFEAADTLRLDYEAFNLGAEPMPYVWAAHPQFICGPEAEVRIPAGISQVVNTLPASWGWGEPETVLDWPEAAAGTGKVRLDRTGPPALKRARKFFLPPGVRPSWTGLLRREQNDWLLLEWDPNQVPYLGVWVDEGAINEQSVAAPEPTTGYYDSLALAYSKKQVTVIEPHGSASWSLTVRLGTAGEPFPELD
ncbi:MAG: hypothetical protein GX495_20910 [Chloroflexi bacterium]|jgi:galactose mutarotase-like enzyme|nr:hypothetical protein [Chloroflexota bacterium]